MASPRSNRLELAIGEPDHLQQQPSIPEARYLGFAEGARLVVDWRLDEFQILFRCSEDQVEIAERIEIAEIAPLAREHLVILAHENLGAAQRIGEAGVDEIAEQIGKEPVGKLVERAHRLGFHRIDQAGAVDEFGLAGLDHRVEFRQRLRWHRQIGVQDHQHVAGRGRKAFSHRVALTLALLLENLDIPAILVGITDALAFLKGAVAGISFDKQDFLGSAEPRHSKNCILDIAPLVAARDQDARGKLPFRKLPDRPADEVSAQAQLSYARQGCDEAVDERTEAEQTEWDQLSLFLTYHLEIREIHQVQEVGRGDVVDLRLVALEFQRLADL